MMTRQDNGLTRYAILPYYLAGAASFAVATLLCVVKATAFQGHYFQPALLSITHLCVLGWATMVIFGASNQLAPVITERKLYSETIPLVVLALKIPGVIILVYSFWMFALTWLTYLGGVLLLSSFLLHAYNMFMTMRRTVNSITSDFMLTAHVWLVLTGVIGLMLLVNLRFPFLAEDHLHYLRLHAFIGIAGWLVQLIIGVSLKLIPMFLLSSTESNGKLGITFYGFNLSLIFFFVEGMVLKHTLGKPVYLLLGTMSLIPYARYIIQCHKTSMRKQTDEGMRQTALALVFLCLPILLLIASFFHIPGFEYGNITGFGFAFIFGFVSILIMGQTFKTLPFIVWMYISAGNKLPQLLPKDLFKERNVKYQLKLYLPGFLLFLSGILLRISLLLYIGGCLMFVAACWYTFQVCLILLKLKKKWSC